MTYGNRPDKPAEMRFIFRDGKKWTVKFRIPNGSSYNSRHLTLAEAQEARDNAIREQGIFSSSNRSRQASANI